MNWDRLRRPVTVVVAVVLAATLLYYAARGIDWREVLRIAAGANPSGLVVVAGIGALTLLLRALRWRLLLNAQGSVSVGVAFWATAAGYFGNSILPARAGELVRTFMVSSRYLTDTTFVLSTALTERVVDGVVLVGVASLIILTVPLQLGWLAGTVKPLAVLGLAAALVIVVAPLLEPVGVTLLNRLRVSSPLRTRLQSTLEQILRGMRTFHNGRRLLGFLGLTTAIWCLDSLATVVGGAALGLEIPIPAAFLLLAALGLASALPSTPGYVGVYQFAAVSALSPFGLSRTGAIAYVLVFQVLMIVVTGFFGSVGLLKYRRAKLIHAAGDASGS